MGNWSAPKSIHESSSMALTMQLLELVVVVVVVVVDGESSVVSDGAEDGDEGDGVIAGQGVVVVGVAALALALALAAAAATLWMDFGDMMVSGGWEGREVGKLRAADEPLRQRRAAS